MFGGFLAGMIVGGGLVWLYGNRLRAYVDHRTLEARARAARTLGAAAEGLEHAKERIEAGLSGEPPGEHRAPRP